MTRTTLTTGAKRYDDMIGYLVAFEQKARTMEVCCDLQNDATTTSTSTASSASCVRHAHSIKRSQRGRSISSRSNATPKNVAIATEVNCMSDNVIVSESDDVEVIINCNDLDGQENVGTGLCSFPETLNTAFTLPLNKLVKCESVRCRIETVSVAQEKFKLGECDEEQFEKILSNDLKYVADQKNFQEISILRPSSILKVQQPKMAGVMFRDPIHEVIPLKHGFIKPNCSVHNLGDQVEIADGIYGQKIGRVVKSLGDVVQVEVGNRKPKLLYISPKMLQPLHGRQIPVLA
jgi:hypothetical protein